jgi:hypothetical protein
MTAKHSSLHKYSNTNNYNSSKSLIQGSFYSTQQKPLLLQTPSLFQNIKEGFAGGIGSSLGHILTYNFLGFPKITVQHEEKSNNENNSNQCVTKFQNCSSILLEYEKCKNDYNCNFEKLDKLRNDYEICSNKNN